MSETEQQDEAPKRPQPQLVSNIIDIQLAVLAGAANDSAGFSVSVSLDVQGTILSGELVGREDYFDELLRRHGESLAEVGAALAEAGKSATEEEGFTESFVHIRDAWRGNNRPSDLAGRGPMWRGRLSSIDGWSFGYTSVEY